MKFLPRLLVSCARMCGWGVAATFSVAGALKMKDLDRFAAALETWSLVPTAISGIAIVIVPVIELAAGLMWILGIARLAAAILIVSMLVIFTAVFAAHLATAVSPTCGCFGLLAAHLEKEKAARFLVARNTVMIGAMVFAYVYAYPNRIPVGTLVEQQSEVR